MIQTDEQMKSTQEVLARLEMAMAALSRKKETMHADWFMVMAEPLLDQIRQLRSEIDAYSGISAAESEFEQLVNSGEPV